MHGTGSIKAHQITTYDFLSLGEVVVDFISTEVAVSLADIQTFRCFVGGQAANLAMNMARLGNRSALAACVGYDGLGQFAREEIDRAGVNSIFLQHTREAPTTVATITRQTQTPDFIIHRGADAHLRSTNELADAVVSSQIVHTSAFALSREPARTTILAALQLAKDNGRLVSLDPNFDAGIWPDRSDFVDILKNTFRLVDITKPSLEDCSRLFGPRNTPDEYAQIFIDWGAMIVLISMGERGIYLACSSGEQYQISANPNLDVQDVTGAGDAYWSGFLNAFLKGHSPIESAMIGQQIAEIKISQFGALEALPDWKELVELSKRVPYSSVRQKDDSASDCEEVRI